jgi:hypothetical protein
MERMLAWDVRAIAIATRNELDRKYVSAKPQVGMRIPSRACRGLEDEVRRKRYSYTDPYRVTVKTAQAILKTMRWAEVLWRSRRRSVRKVMYRVLARIAGDVPYFIQMYIMNASPIVTRERTLGRKTNRGTVTSVIPVRISQFSS